jgi:hypothetical protein
MNRSGSTRPVVPHIADNATTVRDENRIATITSSAKS